MGGAVSWGSRLRYHPRVGWAPAQAARACDMQHRHIRGPQARELTMLAISVARAIGASCGPITLTPAACPPMQRCPLTRSSEQDRIQSSGAGVGGRGRPGDCMGQGFAPCATLRRCRCAAAPLGSPPTCRLSCAESGGPASAPAPHSLWIPHAPHACCAVCVCHDAAQPHLALQGWRLHF